VVSLDAPKALKAPAIAIRSPIAKRIRSGKKGKDSVKINRRLYKYLSE
jgi:hypothetical protein